MRSSTHNQPKTARRLGAAAAVVMSLILAGGPAAMAHAAPGTTDLDRYVTAYQGNDRATYDREEGDFKVCDKERDGRSVYVYFTKTYGYFYDAVEGCTTWPASSLPKHPGDMYVCEEIAGWWDRCSNAVPTR
jgi:hypothetical protein